jgi:hypothetical protein
MKLFNFFKPKLYPKYKHLIPANPTEEEYRIAWKHIFGDYPENCEVTNVDGILEKCGKNNVGYNVKTSYGMISHGGFSEHTEEPVLNDGQSYYYTGKGCTWDTDANDMRFYLINKDTKLPVHFHDVRAIETINNYLNAQLENAKKLIYKN